MHTQEGVLSPVCVHCGECAERLALKTIMKFAAGEQVPVSVESGRASIGENPSSLDNPWFQPLQQCDPDPALLKLGAGAGLQQGSV